MALSCGRHRAYHGRAISGNPDWHQTDVAAPGSAVSSSGLLGGSACGPFPFELYLRQTLEQVGGLLYALCVAIDYRIDNEWGIVVTTVGGELTAEELRRHATTLAGDPRARECDELVDLSEATGTSVRIGGVAGTAKWLRGADTNRRGGKLALLAPAEAGFRIAQLYKVHREHPDIEIRVFRERGDALDWLGLREKG